MEAEEKQWQNSYGTLLQMQRVFPDSYPTTDSCTHVHGLTETILQPSEMVYCHLRGFDLLIMNAVREYLCFRLDSSSNMKSSFLPSQRFSKSKHFVDMLHFLWKRLSSESRKCKPKPATEHPPLQCLRGKAPHHLLLLFFVLWTPKPDHSTPPTSEYSLFSSMLWKSWGHGTRRHLKETCCEEHQWLFWHKAFFPREKEQQQKKEQKQNQIIHIFSVTSTVGSLTRSSEIINHNQSLKYFSFTVIYQTSPSCSWMQYLPSCSCTETALKASDTLILLYSNDCCNQKESQK